MPFTLDVKMTGLCHFIDSVETGAKAKLCALFPNIQVADPDAKAHPVRMLIGNDLAVVRRLEREDVSFELEYEGVEPAAELRGRFEKTIRIAEIVGPLAATKPEVLKLDDPPATVVARIIFDRGEIVEEYAQGVWRIPVNLGDEFVQRRVPSHVSLREPGLKKVTIHIWGIQAGDDGAAPSHQTIVIEPPRSLQEETVTVLISGDCEPLTQVPPSASTVKASSEFRPDRDFLAHYVFLVQKTQDAVKAGMAMRFSGKALGDLKKDGILTVGERPFAVPVRVPESVALRSEMRLFDQPSSSGRSTLALNELEGRWTEHDLDEMRLALRITAGGPVGSGGKFFSSQTDDCLCCKGRCEPLDTLDERVKFKK